jgi:hypothetical protein
MKWTPLAVCSLLSLSAAALLGLAGCEDQKTRLTRQSNFEPGPIAGNSHIVRTRNGLAPEPGYVWASDGGIYSRPADNRGLIVIPQDQWERKHPVKPVVTASGAPLPSPAGTPHPTPLPATHTPLPAPQPTPQPGRWAICPNCKGTGTVAATFGIHGQIPCSKCNGSGHVPAA